MKYAVLIVSVALLTGCPKAPNNARADQMCPVACDKLRVMGCSEGKSAHCVNLCMEIAESGFLDVDFTCLTDATTVDELRKCGVCSP